MQKGGVVFVGPPHGLALLGCCQIVPKGALAMEWVAPQHEEIELNCEVSSYANAEL